MATTKRTATELIRDMEALQAALRQQTCPHCRQRTIAQVGQSIHCTNRHCDGFFVTLDTDTFMALTPAQLASYQAGKTERVQMDIDQELFELRMAQLERDLEARQAARTGNEKVYG